MSRSSELTVPAPAAAVAVPAPVAGGAVASSPRRLRDQTHLLRTVQWCLVSAMALGTLLFYIAGYVPAQRRQSALKMQIEMKQRELSNSRDKAKNLPILALEVQQLERRVQAYDRQFPKQLELGPFIKDLNRLCQQASLQDQRLRPGAPRRLNALQELPIVINFNGEFPAVASFLQQVEQGLPRMTRVNRLKLKQLEARTGAVEVEASVSIFFAEGE